MPLHVLTLHAANPGPMTGAGNWTYLLPGDAPVLIDAGVGEPSHLDAVLREAPGGPSIVVVTHAHADHVSGAPALALRAPRASFVKWPWPERDARYAVDWQGLADGDEVPTPEGPLRVLHTPGHSPDHVALWHEASRTVFTGDLLVRGSTVVIPASAGGSLADYLRSLDRIAALDAVRALPAHGPVIDDPAALVATYRTHRRTRELQVLEVLSAAPSTPEEVVRRIYERLDEALVPVARESVLAHLVKLQGEGRAGLDGDGRWRLIG